MKETEEIILIKASYLDNIFSKVQELQQKVRKLRAKRQPAKKILSNDDMRELLHVSSKLLKKYRESGLLSYSTAGGKYWYTIDDVRKFLKSTKYGVQI